MSGSALVHSSPLTLLAHEVHWISTYKTLCKNKLGISPDAGLAMHSNYSHMRIGTHKLCVIREPDLVACALKLAWTSQLVLTNQLCVIRVN